MALTKFFSVVSGIIFIIVALTYFGQLRKGTSTPNPATWLIWVIVSIFNTITYFIVVEGDWFKVILAIVMTCALTVICVYALVYGKFGKLGVTEKICLTMAIGIIIIWQITQNAVLANLLLQIVYVISFIPTIRGLLYQELAEKPLPWDLAVVSYTCLIIALLSDTAASHWTEYAYPLVNGICGNGVVAILVHFKIVYKNNT